MMMTTYEALSRYTEGRTQLNNSTPVTEQITIPHSAFSDALRRVGQCFTFSVSKPEAEGLAIVGESGTGKTSVLRTFLERHKPTRGPDGMEVPVLFASVPSAPTVKSLAGVILESLHDPDPEHGTENQRSRRIRVLMRETGTRMLMIDEFQHFYDRGTHKVIHHVADWLKILIDDTRATLVVSGLPTCLGVIDQNEQLARRFSGAIHLKRFDWEIAPERKQFTKVLNTFYDEIAKKYDAPEFGSSDMAFRFWVATGGLMGYLTRLLRQLERNAIVEGRKVITLKDLHNAHLQSIWTAQRLPGLPQPFAEKFATEETVDVLQKVRKIGSAIDIPPQTGRHTAARQNRESLNQPLGAR